ncbi:hypothetical protein T4C_12784 [Trichinella pseudospiralis]|uniref:Uncharacterized protein n=1 Tax=Trichinella pseudospiralis TaxID=6337 RepID=A0A0V1GGT9_TRIPS|nr:hypothetical protein T4C_12784 [Trichinella pseudospiralis]
MQPGKAGIVSLYFSNCSKSIDTHYVHICEKSFSRKFQNFLNYRLACFAKNGENNFRETCQVVGRIKGR